MENRRYFECFELLISSLEDRGEMQVHPRRRGRYPALGHFIFFFNEKKINIFRLTNIALFLKVTY